MLPEKFLDKMKRLLPEEEFDEFCNSFEDGERYYSIRLSSLKASDRKEEIFDRLSDNGESISAKESFEQIPWEERGFYCDSSLGCGKHPYHEAGLYYIQEPSAMAPVRFLKPQPGEKILDLCAAPGGKSTQIADRLRGQGILVANEINRDRAKILSLNIERMGVTNALVLNEEPGRLSKVFEGYFDRILVDAPCSGEGMFRKNENAKDEWSPENVSLCANRQEEILDFASKMLLPGGRLVYSTCTFSPEEDEQSILRFLLSHPDFHTVKVPAEYGMEHGRYEFTESYSDETDKDSADMERCRREVSESLRLWPHRVRGEGHFLCVLERDGKLSESRSGQYVPGGRNTKAGKTELQLLQAFINETFVCSSDQDMANTVDMGKGTLSLRLSEEKVISGLAMSFGEQIYLCPEDMPSIKGLRVQRCGLHLGTVRKDRFEPSHSLALAMSVDQARCSFELPSDSDMIKQYLNGQTIRPDPEEFKAEGKVWCLMTTDGFSIGWGKYAGGMIKNHYPKGLRINY